MSDVEHIHVWVYSVEHGYLECHVCGSLMPPLGKDWYLRPRQPEDGRTPIALEEP